LGPYRLLQKIGEGGMGVVHLGLDDANRAVAIKVLRPHVAGDPEARARLAREVDSLQRVRHPQVAEVLDADVDCEAPYVVTRYVPARALDAYVKATGPLDEPALARLGDGLAEALAAIHGAGVVHRDLKPGNVLMLDGDPVVIDFGIAHVADDVRLTTTGLVMGTPGYLSPEVLAGDPVGEATDWWGWAATMAFAATGRPPYGRGPVDAVLDRVRRGEPDLDGVPAALVPVLTRGLAVDPARRPSPGELRQAVGWLRHDEPSEPVTQRIPEVPVTRRVELEPVTERVQLEPPTERVEREPLPLPEPVPLPDPAPLAEPAALAEPAPWTPSGYPRPARTGTVVAGLLALAAVAAVAPVMAALIGFAGSVLARTLDRSTSSLLRRRHERGPRRSDAFWAVVSSPGHLLAAALVAVPAAVLPVLVGVATVFLVGWVVGPGGTAVPGESLPLAAGAVGAAFTAWWGPGGGALRRGTRSLVRGVSPGRSGARVAVGLLLIVAVGAAIVVWQRGGLPDWAPLHRPPWELLR
jgi:serine/threonine protein kinase